MCMRGLSCTLSRLSVPFHPHLARRGVTETQTGSQIPLSHGKAHGCCFSPAQHVGAAVG